MAGARSIGSKGSICPRAASSASICDSGVPARADMTSSVGSYSEMPRKEAVVIVTVPSTGRPMARLEPEPTISIGSRFSAQPAMTN